MARFRKATQPENDTSLICTKCMTEKPLDAFFKDNSGKHPAYKGRGMPCKECALAYSRTPQSKAAQAAYGKTERGKAVHKAANAKYNQTPKGKAASAKKIESAAVWRARPEVKARLKAYVRTAAHKARRDAYNHSPHGQAMNLMAVHRRRARLAACADRSFTAKQWRQVKGAHANACVYCGRDDVPVVMDHVIPITKQGNHSIDNVVPACQSCNASKWMKDLGAFLTKETKLGYLVRRGAALFAMRTAP